MNKTRVIQESFCTSNIDKSIKKLSWFNKPNQKIMMFFYLITLIILITTNVNGITTDKLISYYNFSNNGNDATGYSNLTAGTGVNYVTGKIGNASQLLTATAYYNMTVSSFPIGSNENYSFSFWINTSTIRKNMFVFDKSASSNPRTWIELGRTTAGDIAFVSNNGGGYSIDITSDANLYNNGLWHHVVVVKNGTNAIFYVDNVVKTSNTAVATGTIFANTTHRIGTNEALGNYANYTIDEFSIWYKALDYTEVNDLYNSGLGLTYPFSSPPAVIIGCTGNSSNFSGNLVYSSYNYSNGTIVNVDNGKICINSSSYNVYPSLNFYVNRTNTCISGRNTSYTYLYGFTNNGLNTTYTASNTYLEGQYNSSLGYVINKTENILNYANCTSTLIPDIILWDFENNFIDNNSIYTWNTTGEFREDAPKYGNYTTPNFTSGYTGYGLNMTMTGTPPSTSTGTAIILQNTSFVNDENIGFSFWIKPKGLNEQTFFIYVDGTRNKGIYLDYINTNQIRLYTTRFGVVSDVLNTGVTLNTSLWTKLDVTYNGNNLSLYVNGVYNNSKTTGGSGSTYLLSSGMFVPYPHTDSYFMNAYIDTFRIYTYTPNSTELYETYINDSTNTTVFNLSVTYIEPCNITFTQNSTGRLINFNYTHSNDITKSDVYAKLSSIYKIYLTSTTGYVNTRNLSNGLYEVELENTYNTSNIYLYNPNCTISVCTNNWVRHVGDCIANYEYVNYTDSNNCNEQYDIPSDNGTSVYCVPPANTDKDLWLIIILIVIWIIGIVLALMYQPLIMVLVMVVSFALAYYTSDYFGEPIISIGIVVISAFMFFVATRINRGN